MTSTGSLAFNNVDIEASSQQSDEILSLRWNNHLLAFQSLLAHVKQQNYFSDVSVACAGKLYAVHKLVLSSCSDYFSSILRATNCPQPVVVLKDITASDFEALLSYMYLGEVNIRQDQLSSFLQASESLGVKGLVTSENSAFAECVLEDTVCNVLSPSVSRSQDSVIQTNNNDVSSCKSNQPIEATVSCDLMPQTQVVKDTYSPSKRKLTSTDNSTSASPVAQAVAEPIENPSEDEYCKLKRLKLNTHDCHKDSDSVSDGCSINADISDLYDEAAFETMPQVCVNIKEEPEAVLSERQSLLAASSLESGRCGATQALTLNDSEDCNTSSRQESTMGLAEIISEALTDRDSDAVHYLSALGCDDLPSDGKDKPPSEPETCLMQLEVPVRQPLQVTADTNNRPMLADLKTLKTNGAMRTSSHLPILSKPVSDCVALSDFITLNSSVGTSRFTSGGPVTYLPPGRTVPTSSYSVQHAIVCQYCGKEFAFASDMRRHERCHTGEKPFSCSLCDFKTSQRYNLERHKKTHEPKQMDPNKGSKLNSS
ncbi:BTB/POZ domain [Trinorchestia longiramus]|nr:BTB/POZ domain [Trinorchestia longiramus]